MLEALLLLPLPGAIARALWPSGLRNIGVMLLASVSGWVLGYLVFHEAFGLHELHAFQPEGLLPGTLGAFAVALVFTLITRRYREHRIWSD